MEKYEVLGLIGEGSFGRVYKARSKLDPTEIVALKLISKCGRSVSELTCLRQECDIQKYLKHPNIIRMLDSFETEFEIIVVTEFAKRDLYQILGEQCYFSEEKACKIICDLVSALYYLHSNRVLHRDLKPSNVLVGSDGSARLCDFGFARHMGRSTHVLTSIKGTPLYMAPELMDASPYDHNADIWSMGCIAYEMVVGTPPFITKSILHLVQLIRYREIVWPDFLSANCLSYLQGVLKKDPKERLSWPKLLDHPFINGKVLILEGTSCPQPLTVEQTPQVTATGEDVDRTKFTRESGPRRNLQEKTLSVERPDDSTMVGATRPGTDEWVAFLKHSMEEAMDGDDVECLSQPAVVAMVSRAIVVGTPPSQSGSVSRIGGGQSVTSSTFSSAPIVIRHVASLLSLPFVSGQGEDLQSHLDNVIQVYCDCNIVATLIGWCCAIAVSSNILNNCTFQKEDQTAEDAQSETLLAIERSLCLIARLSAVHSTARSQFSEAATPSGLAAMILWRRKCLQLLKSGINLSLVASSTNITSHILALLTLVLRDDDQSEQRTTLVQRVFSHMSNPDVEVRSLVMDSNSAVEKSDMRIRIRSVALLAELASAAPTMVSSLATPTLVDDIEALSFDSDHSIRQVAEGFLANMNTVRLTG